MGEMRYNWKIDFNKKNMANKRGEVVSSEVRSEIERMAAIDGLLRQIESENGVEERRDLFAQVKRLISQYERQYGQEQDVAELITGWRERVKLLGAEEKIAA